jgi:hypothetical protein
LRIVWCQRRTSARIARSWARPRRCAASVVGARAGSAATLVAITNTIAITAARMPSM